MTYDVKTQNLDIKTTDGICDAFLACAAPDGAYPCVLILMDAFGLRPYLCEMAKTLAAHGYEVLVPNLFYRYKRAPILNLKFPLKPEDMPQARSEIIPLARSYDYGAGLNDARAFFDFFYSQRRVPPQIGITGYCMGGGLAIRVAARYSSEVAAVASFHAGNLATDAADSPHLLLSQLKAELYVAHADNDASMPLEQIARFHDVLERSHLSATDEVYAGAAHGFTMADLPAYNKDALTRHWTALFDLFGRRLHSSTI